MKFTVIAAIFSASFSILLAVFAFTKNPRGVQNRNFALFNIALAIWNMGEISSSLNDHQMALYVYRLSYIGASFVTFYTTAFFWSVANYQMPRLERLVKWLAIIFALISPTSLIIKNISIDLSQLTPIVEIHGVLYYPFMVFFISGLSYSLIPVFSVYSKSNGYIRNQLRYVLAAIAIGVLGTLNYIASQVIDRVPPFYCFIQVAICAVFAMAILKHRLMDITVIIRKTLIYSGVMSILTLIYLAIVTLFTRLFEGLTGYQTVFSSAIGAILITVCFQPLRKRVQGFVDAKFFRQYVDREEKLYELSREVITHTTPEAMAQALMRVLGDSLHPKMAALYLKSRDSDGFILTGQNEGGDLPTRMDQSNPLANYFIDHSQPFIQQDLSAELGKPLDTRRPTRKEEAA